MGTQRTTFTLDSALAEQARELGINVSAAARQGVADAVRSALARMDREAYIRHPEVARDGWAGVESWGEE